MAIASGSHPRHVLAVFAHPDDEAFSCGGLFARLRDRRVGVTLVCATRGEAGEIRIEGLATRELLGELRERELRAAMEHLSVEDVRFLGYRDSGMRGSADNQHPNALLQAPLSRLASEIAEILLATRPAAVITFGPDGIYGHPDHVVIHHATTMAITQTGALRDGVRVAGLYYATAPREQLMSMAARRQAGPLVGMSPDELARVGTPGALIDTIMTLTPSELARKRHALQAHRSQFCERGPFHDLPVEEVEQWLSREHFVRAALPWDVPEPMIDPIRQAVS